MVKFFKRRKLFDEDADWVPQKGRAFKMKARMQKEETREEPKEEPKKDPFRMTAEPPDIKYDFKKEEPRDKQQVLTQRVADQGAKEQPKEGPFRMTAEPPDIKYERGPFRMKVGQPDKKWEKTPEGWTVEAVKKPDNIKTDAEGMDRAYAQGDVYGEGNKEYVAGSHTFTDWFDDFTKIPQWRYVPPGLNPIVDIMNSVGGRAVLGTGHSRRSERYQKARDYLVAHPEVTFLDGHSLGGSVVLQLQKD